MAIGNTRPISAGSRAAGDIVSREARRYQFRSDSISDDRMKVIRNAVYQKMMRYSVYDLKNIIVNYGDANEIVSEEKESLAQLATEVLIINMDANELKSIVDSVRVSQSNLVNDIHTIENNLPKGGIPKGGSRKTFLGGPKKTHKQQEVDEQQVKKMAKQLKVHKSVRKGIPKLRRELKSLLDDFTNLQVQSYAMRLGISLIDGIPIGEVKQEIIDQVITYALVVQNKLKVTFGTAIQDPSACEELLGFTSYYYLTGNANAVGPTEWYAKRKAVQEAKAYAEEKMRIVGKKGRRKSISNITGGATSARQLRKGTDMGPLADVSLSELMQIAGEYGVEVNRKSKPEDIKLAVYRKMAYQNKRYAKLSNKATKQKAFDTRMQSRLDAHASISGVLSGTGASGIPTGSSTGGVPTIAINENGVLSTAINQAVPVYIVGQGKAGEQAASISTAKSRWKKTLSSVLNHNKGSITDPDDFTGNERRLYDEIQNADDPAQLNAIYTAYTKAKKGAKLNASWELEVNQKITDQKDNILYKVAIISGYKNIAKYLEYKHNVNIKHKQKTTRGVITQRRLKKAYNEHNNWSTVTGTTAGNMQVVQNGPDELVGKSKDNWDIIQHMDLAVLRKEIDNGLSGDALWPQLNALHASSLWYLMALRIKDRTLARAIQYKYGKDADWSDSNETAYRNSVEKALKGKKKIGNALKNVIGAYRSMKLSAEAAAEAVTTPGTVVESATLTPIIAGGREITSPRDFRYKVRGEFALPTYIVNTDIQKISTDMGILHSDLGIMQKTMKDNYNAVDAIVNGLSAGAIFAGMGTGTFQFPGILAANLIRNTVGAVSDLPFIKDLQALGELSPALNANLTKVVNSVRFNTGAKKIEEKKPVPRLATGGMSNKIITGDAAGSNMFKGGAKPELVSSNGDLSVTPLNKDGAGRQKVSRMTSTERANALATSISSHVIKFSNKLGDGTTEVSNVGEAIKVYSVKPGITDTINVNGSDTTLAELLGNIYKGIMGVLANGTSQTELLSVIASKPVAAAATGGAQAESPFAGLETSFDNILGGE